MGLTNHLLIAKTPVDPRSQAQCDMSSAHLKVGNMDWSAGSLCSWTSVAPLWKQRVALWVSKSSNNGFLDHFAEKPTWICPETLKKMGTTENLYEFLIPKTGTDVILRDQKFLFTNLRLSFVKGIEDELDFGCLAQKGKLWEDTQICIATPRKDTWWNMATMTRLPGYKHFSSLPQSVGCIESFLQYYLFFSSHFAVIFSFLSHLWVSNDDASNEQWSKPHLVGFIIPGIILPSYIGTIINH